MADYYELLGVPAGPLPKRSRRRTASAPASCIPTPTLAMRQPRSSSSCWPGPTRCSPTPTSAAATTGSAKRASAARPAGQNPGDIFGGGGLGDLFDAFFGGGGGRFRRVSAGPAGPTRGQDLEVVADLTFEQAVFGATLPVTVRTAVACTDCDGTGAGSGTKPVTCADCNGTGQVRTVRQGLIQMVSTRPCPRCQRTRPGGRHAVPDVQRRGSGHHREDLPGRRPGRGRQRHDPAALRPRRRRAPRWPPGRPVRAPAGGARTNASSATATIW